MEITYLGHSCFILVAAGKKILFDPFITPNELAKDIDVNQFNPDYILLSHGHSDHVADVEKIYANSRATVVGNFEVASWLQDKGVQNTHPMNIGGRWKFDFGVVKLVKAVHSSSMPDGAEGGNPAGFAMTTPEKTSYYAGNTALTMDIKLTGESYEIDFAFLPIGDNFPMDIDDALKTSDFSKTSRIIPMHFDTFPYIKIDREQALCKAKEYGKNYYCRRSVGQ